MQQCAAMANDLQSYTKHRLYISSRPRLALGGIRTLTGAVCCPRIDITSRGATSGSVSNTGSFAAQSSTATAKTSSIATTKKSSAAAAKRSSTAAAAAAAEVSSAAATEASSTAAEAAAAVSDGSGSVTGETGDSWSLVTAPGEQQQRPAALGRALSVAEQIARVVDSLEEAVDDLLDPSPGETEGGTDDTTSQTGS